MKKFENCKFFFVHVRVQSQVNFMQCCVIVSVISVIVSVVSVIVNVIASPLTVGENLRSGKKSKLSHLLGYAENSHR